MSNKKDVEREEKLINAARKGDLESVLVSLDLSFIFSCSWCLLCSTQLSLDTIVYISEVECLEDRLRSNLYRRRLENIIRAN